MLLLVPDTAQRFQHRVLPSSSLAAITCRANDENHGFLGNGVIETERNSDFRLLTFRASAQGSSNSSMSLACAKLTHAQLLVEHEDPNSILVDDEQKVLLLGILFFHPLYYLVEIKLACIDS